MGPEVSSEVSPSMETLALRTITQTIRHINTILEKALKEPS
jgi:hypothetical protein